MDLEIYICFYFLQFFVDFYQLKQNNLNFKTKMEPTLTINCNKSYFITFSLKLNQNNTIESNF